MADNYLYSTEGTQPSITGGYPVAQLPILQNYDAINQLAKNNDPAARAILTLDEYIKNQANKFQYDIDAFTAKIASDKRLFEDSLNRYEKKLDQLNNWIVGIAVFIGVTFIATQSLVFFDLIKEKDLGVRYSEKYNTLYEQYTEKAITLLQKITDLEKMTINFKNQLDMLHARNPSLK
jgi:hypothetical protein